MPLSRSRDYLSIGEVLEAVQADFPDVTISKIRFLEAEGLISPERTPSGYRKFYEEDVARLRAILTLQRDRFMPLKVIRQRLDGGNGAPLEAVPDTPAAAVPETTTAPVAAVDMTDVSLDRDELRVAAGLEEDQLRGLLDHKILTPGDDERFDGNDLAIAKAARGFFAFGVEPRHLRLFRQVVERETGLLEQIVTPLSRRRDPDAPAAARRSLTELLALSRQMREALLRSSLDDLL